MSSAEERPTPPGEPSVSGLVREARAGDRARFGELYLRLLPGLLAWAALRVPAALRSRLDPADVVQEVWVRALASFATYDASAGTFRAWTFGIARHVLLKALRTLREQVAVGCGSGTALVLEQVPDEVTSVGHRLAASEELARFLAAVEALEPAERTLLIQHGLEGHTLAAVAGGLGLGVEAAKKRWQRLRVKITGLCAPIELCAVEPEPDPPGLERAPGPEA